MMRWCLSLLLSTTLSAVMGAQACDQAAVARAAAAVRQQQQALLHEAVPQMDTEVAPALRPKIVGFKEALVALADASFGCAPAEASAASLQSGLEQALAGLNPAKGSATAQAKTDTNAETGIYGNSLYVHVTAPANGPTIRLVELGFDIACGQDRVLLAYEPGSGGLHRTMRWQSEPYDQISGAFGGFFDYVFLPGSGNALWRVAVAHGTDWCTSRWSGYKLALLEPALSGTARVVWKSEGGFVIESDPRMVARPNGFELRLDVGTIESEQMVRKGIFRYRVSGDTVERVQPFAADGRGFVDAWLQAPWNEARQWSLPEGLAGLEQVHEAFARGHKDASVIYSYGPVRACLVKGRYEVEIDAAPGGPEFYAIDEGKNGYTMVNYGTTQDERCAGRDLMKR